jgi:hypothetical protein
MLNLLGPGRRPGWPEFFLGNARKGLQADWRETEGRGPSAIDGKPGQFKYTTVWGVALQGIDRGGGWVLLP